MKRKSTSPGFLTFHASYGTTWNSTRLFHYLINLRLTVFIFCSTIGGITVLQGYFTVKKDRVLLNHVIRKIRTSSAIDCAMFCLRRPKCQSFNFDRTSEGSKQCDDVKSNRCPNCELNSAKHLAHAKDFIPREGYYYYHYKITQDWLNNWIQTTYHCVL